MTSQKDITDTHDSEQEIVKSEVRTSWILIIVLVALAFWAGSNHITENVTKVTQDVYKRQLVYFAHVIYAFACSF